MHPVVEKISQEARGMWRFRRYALITAWAVCLLGWFVVFIIPDTFEARARVNVDTKTPLTPLLRDIAVDSDVPTQLNIVRQALLGATTLDGVAHKLGLDGAAQSAGNKQQLLASLSSRLEIVLEPPATRDPRVPNTFYRITFRDGNRDTAIAVVDALLNEFVEKTMGSEYTGTQKAQRFFEGQVKAYGEQLTELEAKLADFKKKNMGLVPGEEGDYFQRLTATRTEIDRLEAQLSIATSRRAELQRQLRGETPFVPAASSASGTRGGAAGGSSDTTSRIAETESRLNELLLRFTDKHPDVLATRETLNQLKVRQQEEIAALRRGDAGAAAASGAASNPVFQNIQLQANQTDVEIAALRVQLAERRRIEGDLRRVADTAPEVEAEYQSLTRDYTVTQSQYKSMIERLERARLSEDAAETGVIRFDIVDPPTASLKPIFPNRTLLLAVVLFGGIVVGLGVAWLMHMLRPVFSSARSITELTGLPVLGSVSRTWLEKQKSALRHGLLRYSALAGLLLVMFIVVEVIKNPASRYLRDLLG
jgi:polysaccharide chain length determinant protein (PEP-CTERM system associated)